MISKYTYLVGSAGTALAMYIRERRKKNIVK